MAIRFPWALHFVRLKECPKIVGASSWRVQGGKLTKKQGVPNPLEEGVSLCMCLDGSVPLYMGKMGALPGTC